MSGRFSCNLQTNDMGEEVRNKSLLPTNIPLSPAGLEALYLVCKNVYPDQPNPLQVAAIVKFWLGGPDPLDYISMYSNPGNSELGVPAHWHYVSFGLSDLHGDGRVHDKTGPEDISGFGFELTFRLKREPEETTPPAWPANLLQSLAKYVFHSGNVLYAGDHVSWHRALDGSESLMEHILLTEDPQLGTVPTPNGRVALVQVVGITRAELEVAQRWSPHGLLHILRNIPRGGCGGEWLVTDMRRGMSMFELEPSAVQVVKEGIQNEGSNLSGVTGFCSWRDSSEHHFSDIDHERDIFNCQKEISSGGSLSPYGSSFWYNEEFESTELLQSKVLDRVHLTFNLESGSLLPLAIRGRVKHGRHFTFKPLTGKCVVTLVGETVTGKCVDLEKPFVATGGWLQVLIPEPFLEEIATQLDPLESTSSDKLVLPKTYDWPERGLTITILPDLPSVGRNL